MTAGMFERRIFHPSLSACAALGLAGILLAACEREEKTAQKQAQEQAAQQQNIQAQQQAQAQTAEQTALAETQKPTKEYKDYMNKYDKS